MDEHREAPGIGQALLAEAERLWGDRLCLSEEPVPHCPPSTCIWQGMSPKETSTLSVPYSWKPSTMLSLASRPHTTLHLDTLLCVSLGDSWLASEPGVSSPAVPLSWWLLLHLQAWWVWQRFFILRMSPTPYLLL